MFLIYTLYFRYTYTWYINYIIRTQIISSSGQQLHLSRCDKYGAYVGAVETMMCVVYVSVAEGE